MLGKTARTGLRGIGCALLSAPLLVVYSKASVESNHVFQSFSKDLDSEVEKVAELLDLKPGMTYCEIGPADGLHFAALAKKVMPGGHVYGTAPNLAEVKAFKNSALLAGIPESAITATLASNEPSYLGFSHNTCDAVFSRLVYHMLPIDTARHYLQQLIQALKMNGKVLIVDLDPDNDVWTREGATALPVKMKVVPMAISIEEFKQAGFTLERALRNWSYLSTDNFQLNAYGLMWSVQKSDHSMHYYGLRFLPDEFLAPKLGPTSPEDVLTFWYGTQAYPQNLSLLDVRSAYMQNRIPILMGGRLTTGQDVAKVFDAECATFARLILLIGTRQLKLSHVWTTAWGRHARMLLLDQLPRNVFRGTWMQYAFANESLRLAREFAEHPSAHVRQFPSTVPIFTIISLIHSESINDFDLCEALLHELMRQYGPDPFFSRMGDNIVEHRAVIEQFGRFPHRNSMLGRVTTPEEKLWLTDSAQPTWARNARKQLWT